jgi:2,4-dienoyl-CoA reductase-like NADH-dependent reductase (Old Yellow Enzyme family)
MVIDISDDDINEVIERFVTTSRLAKEAGFHGIQVHSAHGMIPYHT